MSRAADQLPRTTPTPTGPTGLPALTPRPDAPVSLAHGTSSIRGGSLGRLRGYLREPQHRDATLLLANTGLAAVAGLAFWLVLTRVLGLEPAAVGVGYAIVAVGTTIGLLAKGGLDTAVVRALPRVDRRTARRLVLLAVGVACSTAILIAAALTLAATTGHALSTLSGASWIGAAVIGILLAAAWLLDAYFLAAGEVRVTLLRTLAASAVRLVVPFLAIAALAPGPVAWAWAAGLVASVAVAVPFLRGDRRPSTASAPNDVAPHGAPTSDPLASSAERAGPAFFATANRNLAGSAAEFLPGLLLAPVVLAIDGPEAAAYFGMAWTMASLLFLAASAVGRSALAAMARPSGSLPTAVRRGALQAAILVAGGAVLGMALAPLLLGIFGPDYAAQASTTFMLLCASAFVVAPASLYLAVLRIRERTPTLVLVPILTLALLLGLVPLLEGMWGLPGVAAAWILANTPFGLWSLVRLVQEAKEVKPSAPDQDSQPHGGRAHVE